MSDLKKVKENLQKMKQEIDNKAKEEKKKINEIASMFKAKMGVDEFLNEKKEDALSEEEITKRKEDLIRDMLNERELKNVPESWIKQAAKHRPSGTS